MNKRIARHKHQRNTGSFERHRSGHTRVVGGVRRGRAWIAFDNRWTSPLEPHYRQTARIAALPGNHLRRVEEPERSAHGKDGQ